MNSKSRKNRSDGRRPLILIEDLVPKSDVRGGAGASTVFGVLQRDPKKNGIDSKKNKQEKGGRP